MKIVIAIATRETDTPKYPMTSRESVIGVDTLKGAALNNIAKCVRWSHSHTVKEMLERMLFLEQPRTDHCPILSTLCSELIEIKKMT